MTSSTRGWLAAVALTALSGCGTKPHVDGNGTAGGQPVGGKAAVAADAPPGLVVAVRDGAPAAAPGAERAPTAAATRLGDGDVGPLLARLEPLPREADAAKPFRLRAGSKPPPRTGDTVDTAFPPDATMPPPPADASTNLAVARYAPDGEVALAPHVSITFNQPMVAVTSQADAENSLPVTLSPQPAGKWRWVGSRTLLFQPETRMPMATEYRVGIAPGVRSASGKALASDASFAFSTPAPELQSSWPNGGPQPLRPVMIARFDQRVDPAAVIPLIRVEFASESLDVRAATAAEIEASPQIARRLAAARTDDHGDRVVVFVAERALPASQDVRVVLPAGLPSAEGPRTTGSEQSFEFRTYDKLVVEEAHCAGECRPGSPWYIRFNNPIDEDQFDPEGIAISPALPGRRVEMVDRHLTVYGRSEGRTDYTLTVPAAIVDTFGQSLGDDHSETFKVGPARPTLFGPSGLVVLDPAAKTPAATVFSTQHKQLRARIYAVSPEDWPRYAQHVQQATRNLAGAQPPGTLVDDRTISVAGNPDALTETAIDLSAALENGRGHAVVVIEPVGAASSDRQTLRAWFQRTDIALDAFADASELHTWATNLADGTPLSGVAVKLADAGATATTGSDGTTALALPAGTARDGNRISGRVLVASKDDDVAILPEHTYWWSDHTGWVSQNQADELRWFVFDDRKLYKPGETVRIKGWLRRIDRTGAGGAGGDLVALRGAAKRVTYKVRGSRGNDLASGSATVSAAGGFDFQVKLPPNANLGSARIELSAVGQGGDVSGRNAYHGFQIQEFRRPEFEVTSRGDEGPHMLGETASVEARAAYYAGGPLAGADVSWRISATPGSFSPPNRDEYTFGTWTPWWVGYGGGWPGSNSQATFAQHQGKTDAGGTHAVALDFVSMNPPRAYAVSAQATVMDVNRQAWTTTHNVLVHPASLYVGLRSDRYFVNKGEPLEVAGVVSDLDGKLVAGTKVVVTAARLEWRYARGEYREEEADVQTCDVTSADAPFECSFATKVGGSYRIRAALTDSKGRQNVTEFTRWVAGGARPPARNVELEQVQLIPDRQTYAPGQIAKILVQSPFSPAQALVSYRRDGVVKTEVVAMDEPTTTLEIPVVDAYTPNLHLQVDVVGAAPRVSDKGEPLPSLPKRPAYAQGQLKLSIPPVMRTLAVDVEPAAPRVGPGASTSLALTVRDAGGKAVANADVAVIVVDEAVLALTGYATPSPIETFYSERPAGVRDHLMRQYVTLSRADATLLAANGAPADDALMEPEADMEGVALSAAPPAPMAKRAAAPGGTRQRASAGGQPIVVRTNFAALAHYAPAVKTDAQGRARVAIKLPDNLTRYRIMAIAAAGDKLFGKGESTITARMPLMVRPSAPRFLNFGDAFELPVVVQNQTDEPMTVNIGVRMTNAALTDGAGRQVSVPANDRVEVRFATAARQPGTAHVQVAAAAGPHADAAELSLPVYTPATTEAFATYGSVEDGAVRQPVAMPADVVPQFGGLSVTTSSTQLQALTDAVLYLVNYPFECAEQMSSRVLAIAGLRDVLSAFEADGLPAPEALATSVARDLEMLARLQNGDGGFAFWRRGDESWPYVSIHVAHAFARARSKGYEVAQQNVDRSLGYLRDIENRIPHWYGKRSRQALSAYALYTRKLLGDGDVAKARALVRDVGADELPMEAVGWLLTALAGERAATSEVAALRRRVGNSVSETAGTASISTSYGDNAHLLLHSSRRTDGVVLEALLADQPASDLVEKLARGLLAHRVRGRWSTTQDNAFVLLAMDAYFRAYESKTPRFAARTWLGSAFAAEHRFRGRSTERQRFEVPMSYLASNLKAPTDLTLAKSGQGRLYYRIGMTYAPANLSLAPADYGFAVERAYEPVDSPGDVKRESDGTWILKAGARVRVRVTMVAPSRRYHVALVDPLPAGLEPLNASLAVTEAVPTDPKPSASRGPWWWFRPWYDHQNLRDERVEAFASLVYAGVHEYTYVARATTPGQFVVPPPKAEEMYAPETFGRGATDRVHVVAP